jgi:hypothetical protein
MITCTCKGCGRETGFKRHIGVGTIIAIILTFSLWLFMIPFYPKRCVACGLPQTKTPLFKIGGNPWNKTWQGIIIIVVGFAILVKCASYGDESSKTTSKVPEEQAKTQTNAPPQPVPKESSTSIGNEKAAILKSTFFGHYENAKRIKIPGQATLKVWGPYIEYFQNLPEAYSIKEIALRGQKKLFVSFDELWKAELDDLFTPEEKRKYKGHFDIGKIYWKNNKIQAITLEKEYISNPVTKKRLPRPNHYIVNIYDREYVLRKLADGR